MEDCSSLDVSLNLQGRKPSLPIGEILQAAGEEGLLLEAKDKARYAIMPLDEDLIAAGVIDPTKVTRTALQNAASIASLMLTTEAMVAEIPEKKTAAAPGGGPEGMDY